jgi:hypothetical protein
VGLGFLIVEPSRSQTHHIRLDSPGRVISPSQKPLPDNTQLSKDTDIHALGGFRTRNPSKRTAVDQRPRPHGHWDRLVGLYSTVLLAIYTLPVKIVLSLTSSDSRRSYRTKASHGDVLNEPSRCHCLKRLSCQAYHLQHEGHWSG